MSGLDEEYYREEPDCGTCCDTGRVGRRRCPACNPGLTRVLWSTLRWRVWGTLARLFPRSRIAASYNEPPF